MADRFASVLCTGGFRPDYGTWIPWPDAFDAMGFPIQTDGESAVVDGLFFMGVHFLRTRKSSIMWGAGDDANAVADRVAVRLGAGYVQMVAAGSANAPATLLLAKADTSGTAYVVGGALLAYYQAAGGPAGAQYCACNPAKAPSDHIIDVSTAFTLVSEAISTSNPASPGVDYVVGNTTLSLGGTDATVPSMILSKACCTPSPETSRVIEGLSLLRAILSISSI